jgi:hypothetical protein
MLLAAMYPWREGKTGKTFLMKHLSDFVNEHGNDYELERYCDGTVVDLSEIDEETAIRNGLQREMRMRAF